MHEALAKANFDRDVATLTPAAVKRLRMIVHSKEFPVLDVTIEHSKPIRLKFICDNWNEIPPSIKILYPDGTQWNTQLPGGIFHGGIFICMRGVREYHGAPGGHTADHWDNYRDQDGMNLIGILMQIASAWRKAVP